MLTGLLAIKIEHATDMHLGSKETFVGVNFLISLSQETLNAFAYDG